MNDTAIGKSRQGKDVATDEKDPCSTVECRDILLDTINELNSDLDSTHFSTSGSDDDFKGSRPSHLQNSDSSRKQPDANNEGIQNELRKTLSQATCQVRLRHPGFSSTIN
jgi:hypothetical protein